MMHNRTIIFSIVLFAVMTPLIMNLLTFDLVVMGVPITTPECASDFWSRTCCWLDNAGGVIRKHCQTCLSDGYGGYTINCETTQGPVSKTSGDIYKTPTRGPAVQDTPQSETSEKRQGGIIGNWGLLKTDQDNENKIYEEKRM